MRRNGVSAAAEAVPPEDENFPQPPPPPPPSARAAAPFAVAAAAAARGKRVRNGGDSLAKTEPVLQPDSHSSCLIPGKGVA